MTERGPVIVLSETLNHVVLPDSTPALSGLLPDPQPAIEAVTTTRRARTGPCRGITAGFAVEEW